MLLFSSITQTTFATVSGTFQSSEHSEKRAGIGSRQTPSVTSPPPITRAINQQTVVNDAGVANIDFATTVYDQKLNTLYLGAEKTKTANPQQGSLVGARVQRQDDGNDAITFTPLATDVANTRNQKISSLALAGKAGSKKLLVTRNGVDGKTMVSVAVNDATTALSPVINDADGVATGLPLIATAGNSNNVNEKNIIISAVSDGRQQQQLGFNLKVAANFPNDVINEIALQIPAINKPLGNFAVTKLNTNQFSTIFKNLVTNNGIIAGNVLQEPNSIIAIITAASADITKQPVIDAAGVLSLAPADLAGGIDATRVKNDAIVPFNADLPTTLADTATLAANAVAETLIDGAARAIEGGIAWGVRIGDVDDIANVSKTNFQNAATEISGRLIVDSVSKYAADKVAANADTGDAAENMLAFVNNDDTKGITKRVILSATEASTVAKDDTSDLIKSFCYKFGKNDFLFNNLVADTIIDTGGVQRHNIVKTATQQNTLANLVTKVVDPVATANPNISDTHESGVLAGLQAALAYGFQKYTLPGLKFVGGGGGDSDADGKPNAAGDYKLIEESTEATLQPSILAAFTEVKNTLNGQKDVAKTGVDLLNPAIITPIIFPWIQSAVTDANDGRLKKAVVEADSQARLNAAGDVAALIVNAVTAAKPPLVKIANPTIVDILVELPILANPNSIQEVANSTNQDNVTNIIMENIMTHDSTDEASAAALAGTLGLGVRNTTIFDLANNIQAFYINPVLTNSITFQAGLNPSSLLALNTINGNIGIKTKLSDIIIESTKKGLEEGTAKLIANINADVTQKLTKPISLLLFPPTTITASIKPDDLQKVVMLAGGATKNDVVDIIADVGVGGHANADATDNGVAMAIEAGLAWGVRKATMNNTDVEIKNLLINVGGDGVLNKLSTQLDVGGIKKPLAKAVADDVIADAGLQNELVSVIKNSVKKGTEDAAIFLATNNAGKLATGLAVNPPSADSVTNKAALSLEFDKATLAGQLDNVRITNASGKATAALSATEVTKAGSPIAAADSLVNGAIAVFEGALGWAVKETIVENPGSRAWRTEASNDGVNRGFAVLDNILAPVKHGANNGSAEKFNLVPDADNLVLRTSPVAFYNNVNVLNKMDSILIDTAMDIYYDSEFDQFFIGLSGIQRGITQAPIGGKDAGVIANQHKDGGGTSVMIGSVDSITNKISLKSIIANPTAAMFNDVTKDQYAVGFHRTDAQNEHLIASALKVRTMHTTTGKDYLIVNGGVTDFAHADNIKTFVCALPLMSKNHVSVGQLAKKDFTNLAQVVADFSIVDRAHNYTNFTADEKKIVVGADPQFIGGADTDQEIVDLQVFGDTVYAALAGDRAAGKEAGIFQSSALFDQDGVIRSWTPWQRVAGTDKVAGFGITDTGTCMYLDGANNQAVKATAWGKSDQVATADDHLTSRLQKIFPNGVARMVNFNEKTPGFNQKEFSMIAAVGGDTVALIQTGVKPGGGQFTPTADFIAGNEITTFNKQALTAIAPLTCVDVLHKNDKLLKAATDGYLYVGGRNGVARLQTTVANDAGWDSNGGLDATNTVAGFDFKSLPQFSGRQITALAADGVRNKVVALTRKSLGRGKFESKIVATAKDGGVAREAIINLGTDLVLTKDLAIVATTTGLYKVDDLNAIVPVSVPGIEGTPIKLAFVPDVVPNDTDLPASGNLFVLAVKDGGTTGKIYRFDVQGAFVTPIPSATIERTNINTFSTDGSVLFSGRNRVSDTADVLKIKILGTDVEESLSELINVSANDEIVGAPIRNTASGAWVTSVGNQIRVNE